MRRPGGGRGGAGSGEGDASGPLFSVNTEDGQLDYIDRLNLVQISRGA